MSTHPCCPACRSLQFRHVGETTELGATGQGVRVGVAVCARCAHLVCTAMAEDACEIHDLSDAGLRRVLAIGGDVVRRVQREIRLEPLICPDRLPN